MSIATESIETETASIPAPTRPEAPFRVALVGAGFIADYHAEILAGIDDARLVAVCDPDRSRALDLQAKWNIESVCDSISELLEQVRPDVVHVLSPPATHYDVGRELLAAGVNVLLEKPMTLCRAESQSLAELAAEKGIALGVNHNWRSQPLFQRALADIKAKKIGPVRQVISINSLPLFQLLGGQHDHWMFAQPTNVLFEQAPHPLSQVVQLTGKIKAAETQWSGPVTLRGGKPFYTDWQFNLQGRQATAQVVLGFGRSFPDARLHILGVDGTIHIDQLNDLYVLDRRTTYIDACDRFVRGLKRAGATASGACKGMFGYATSLLGITGRRDVYYLGMQESVESFYRRLIETGTPSDDLDSSLHVMDALQRVVNNFADLDNVGDFDNPPRVAATPKTRTPSAGSEAVGTTLVIGATGFIGRHLVKRFADEGIPLRILARSPRRIADLTAEYDLDVRQGDITNKPDIQQAMEGCDTIIHLVAGAPEDWKGFEHLFIDGLQNTLEAAATHRAQRVIFASSIASLYLGKAGEIIHDQTPVDPKAGKRCHYARAKILCEQMLQQWRQQHDLPTVVMRPGIVIGKGAAPQHLGVGEWPSDIDCVRWGRNTSSPMPLVLVEDVVSAFLNAAGAPVDDVNGKAFNLVGDVRLSADEYVTTLREESDRDFKLHRQSVAFWTGLELFKWGIKAAARKPNNVRMTWREVAYRTGAATFDTSATKQVLRWQPEQDREAFIEKGIRAALG